MKKTSYSFVSSYYKLVNVNFFHNFYRDNLLRGLIYKIEEDTADLLRNYNIIFRKTENGFTLLHSNDSKFNSPAFSGGLHLIFHVQFPNKSFLNFTDVPFSNNQKFIFSNTQDSQNETLHKNNFVDISCIEECESNGLNAELSLFLNTKNQFFGSATEFPTRTALEYAVYFNSRKIKLRYNFYSNTTLVDFKNYFITDDQSTFKINNFSKRELANGKIVHCISIDELIMASDNLNLKLFLKKEIDFLSNYSMHLPLPDIKNISYDSEQDLFFNDLFILI